MINDTRQDNHPYLVIQSCIPRIYMHRGLRFCHDSIRNCLWCVNFPGICGPSGSQFDLNGNEMTIAVDRSGIKKRRLMIRFGGCGDCAGEVATGISGEWEMPGSVPDV